MATKKKSPAKKAAPKEKAAPKKEPKSALREPRRGKKAATKTTPSRTVAKVSLLRGVDVGAWVETVAPAWMKRVTTRLVELVSKKVPEATVSMKWGRPVFELRGPFAWVMPAKSHVTFGFWRGADLTDANELLDGSGSRMRHLKIGSAAELDIAMLTALVTEAAALNVKLGDPTKR